MPKEEWGVKRLCPKTGKRFYDLNKSPIVSPYTGDVVETGTGNKSRMMVADKPDGKTEEDLVETEADVDLDEADTTDVDLDDDLLDDDDEDNVSLDDIADVAGDDEEN